MNKMKETIHVLGIASYRFLPPITGGQKGIALFYKYFSRLVECYCASVKDIPVEAKEGDYTLLPIFSNSKFRYINPIYFFSLRKIIREKGISHVILEHPYYGWLGLLLKKFTGIKLIVHSHNIEGLRFRSLGKWWWKIMFFYEKKTHQASDISFFITEEEKQFAIRHFQLEERKCTTITFGTEAEKPVSREDKIIAKKTVCSRYGMPESTPLLFFNAAFNYAPNLKALDNILSNVNPLLLESGQPYQIIICGIDLPNRYEKLIQNEYANITYAGFVADIRPYFNAADIFLNPITEGGGIKTKVVEALAANCSVVSFRQGAYGIPAEAADHKLFVAEDNNYSQFSTGILKLMREKETDTPDSFFSYFNWEKITEKAKNMIESSLSD